MRSPRSPVLRILAQAVGFIVLAAATYGGGLWLTASIGIDGVPLLLRMNHVNPAGEGQATLTRFREAETFGPVDIVAIGSSHAFRSLDPRLFSAEGVRFFNLGSMAQSPLNSYYVLNDYEPKLKPKVLLVEVFWWILHSDQGVCASSLDLITNLPPTANLTEMALATRRIEAVNFILAKRFGVLDSSRAVQKDIPGERYISGGFSEYLHPKAADPLVFGKQPPIELSKVQLDYLARIIDEAHQRGLKVLVVGQPMPEEWRRGIANADEVDATLEAFARQHGTEYLDFSKRLGLDTEKHFYDSNHLNMEGAQIFTKAVIESLRERGMLPERTTIGRN